jgi:hypothetical protein
MEEAEASARVLIIWTHGEEMRVLSNYVEGTTTMVLMIGGACKSVNDTPSSTERDSSADTQYLGI